MTYEALQQQLHRVPVEYLADVANFLDLLKFKIVVQSKSQPHRTRQLGGYEGQIVIHDDFDDLPSGFEEYS